MSRVDKNSTAPAITAQAWMLPHGLCTVQHRAPSSRRKLFHWANHRSRAVRGARVRAGCWRHGHQADSYPCSSDRHAIGGCPVEEAPPRRAGACVDGAKTGGSIHAARVMAGAVLFFVHAL